MAPLQVSPLFQPTPFLLLRRRCASVCPSTYQTGRPCLLVEAHGATGKRCAAAPRSSNITLGVLAVSVQSPTLRALPRKPSEAPRGSRGLPGEAGAQGEGIKGFGRGQEVHPVPRIPSGCSPGACGLGAPPQQSSKTAHQESPPRNSQKPPKSSARAVTDRARANQNGHQHPSKDFQRSKNAQKLQNPFL